MILQNSVARITGWAIAATLLLLWIHVSASQADDFDIFLQAAADLPRRENIYTATYQGHHHYYYSVLFALILQPFTALPPYWVKAVWLALNIVMILRIWQYCSKTLRPYTQFSARKHAAWILLCVTGCSHFLRDNFQSCQLTVCMLWLTLEGLALVRKGKPAPAAALLALAINIKLLPLVVVPYLLYCGRLRTVVWLALFYIGSLWLPAAVLGADYNATLLTTWWALVNPTNAEHVIDVSEKGLHGLSTLLPIYLMPDAEPYPMLPLRRHIAALDAREVMQVLLYVRLVLAGFTLWFLRRLPFRPARDRAQELWEISYILLLVPLIFPHQQGYAFFFAAPAIVWIAACLLQDGIRHPRMLCASILFALSLLAMNIAFWFDLYRTFFDHFKVLTFGALLLIVLLAICTPRKLYCPAPEVA